MTDLRGGEESFAICRIISTQNYSVTDGRSDGQMGGQTQNVHFDKK